MDITSGIAFNQTDLVATDTARLTHQTEPGPHRQDQSKSPLPRPERRKRRSKADRGLPLDEELTKLAQAYLDRQRKLWPKLAEAGVFAESTPDLLAQMVADFKRRHRGGKVDVEGLQLFVNFCSKLAGSYNRFSCDNSSPMSVLDQMVNSLDKAQSEGRLIPWQYVFADYSVTGLDASRQGYKSYKKLLDDKDQLIETTYIDDFTRASRDAIEWWKLAALSKRVSKRMIGASDGFDLSSPDWDIKITIYSLLSRLFIKGLREKVKRGMRGAARRGTSLGKLGLGFTRRPHFDEHGIPVLDQDGRPVFEPCIDPATRDSRLLLFQMFVEQSLSPYQIIREFNRQKIDGWNGWTEGGVKKLLFSPDAIGVFIWNKTRREYDPEAEKWIVIKNPRSEWVVRYSPELAIVPIPLWASARRKLAAMRSASPLTGRKLSRNQVKATTLFSGTLFCEYCGEEIKLNRSTTKYKQSACLNGLTGAHDCKLSASKSSKHVEDYILDYLRSTVLTDAHLDEIVVKANEHLAAEAQKPQVDTQSWKAEVRKLQAKIKKLVLFVENEDDQSLCVSYNERIKELQREVIVLQKKIRDAEVAVHKRVKPLSLDKARQYLDQLRETLNADIPAAAESIRAITGPIKIRQEPIPGRKTGARWIATFHPDLLQAIRFLANGKLEPLAARDTGENQPTAVEVVIEKVPQYERLASTFKRLRESGASIESIASAHGISYNYAVDVLKFADTGQRPKWKSGKRTGTGNRVKYIEISPQVIELAKQKIPFKTIAKQLGVGEATVRRAFDYGCPDAVRQAAETGKRPKRASYSRLGEDIYNQIRSLLRAGKKSPEIARTLCCGESTVYRVKLRLDRERDTLTQSN